MIFFHRGLRARNGGLGCGFVDRGRFDRHVGEDGNGFARDLGESFADRERGFAAAFENTQLAGLERGQHRDVLRIDAELTVHPGEHDHLDIFRVGFRLRRDDFQS